jgi:REP-associated tyrosine transposase
MSNYRRARTAGGTFFFTVVSYRRQSFLCDDAVRSALRDAVRAVGDVKPFTVDAWVLLPDHLHCIWTLPPGDGDFSSRWSQIKARVSREIGARYCRTDWLTGSKRKHRESTIWQRRFWEHCIRDEEDLRRHMDYVHFNPVKHGLVKAVADWPYSTFHRLVAEGVYPETWAGSGQRAPECDD